MAEGFFSKAKRNVKRAIDFSGENSIRRNRDLDETTSGVDYMMSRGKRRTPQDQSDRTPAERVHKKVIVDDVGSSAGVASNAVQSGKINYGIKGHFQERAANTPAGKLFKRLKRKKDNSEMAL